MADFFDSNDLNVPDKSPLKTGNMRKEYNKCGKGYKTVNGKCVKIKRGKNGK